MKTDKTKNEERELYTHTTIVSEEDINCEVEGFKLYVAEINIGGGEIYRICSDNANSFIYELVDLVDEEPIDVEMYSVEVNR